MSQIVDGTGNSISTGVVYGIRGVASGKYLDGRAGQTEPFMTGGTPKDNGCLKFEVVKTNLGYALKGVASGRYLDGRAGQADPVMTNRDPINDSVLSFKFEKTNGGEKNVAIKGVASGKYLDGRAGQIEPFMTQRNPLNDPVLQFVFVPQNYKLKAAMSEFDFGEQFSVTKLLEGNKELAFVDKKVIVCGATGISVEGTYGQAIEESFSFGFSQTIGIGIETEMSCGIPLLAEGKVTVSASFEFSANQQKTTTNTKNFESKYAFEPEETGIYEVGMTCHMVKDLQLPFTAKVLLSATTDDNSKTSYTGNQVKALLYYSGFDANITKINSNSVEATVSGKVRASFAVSSQVYSKKIGDIEN